MFTSNRVWVSNIRSKRHRRRCHSNVSASGPPERPADETRRGILPSARGELGLSLSLFHSCCCLFVCSFVCWFVCWFVCVWPLNSL